MINVTQIEYISTGDASTSTDGVKIGIILLKNGFEVYNEPAIFSGHSCIVCPPGKEPVFPRLVTILGIKADTLKIIAHDVEHEKQYIAVNGKRYHIPIGADATSYTHTFKLEKPFPTMMLVLIIIMAFLFGML